MKNILYFSGSNSPSSVNQALVTLLSGLPDLAGRLINLCDFNLPIFHPAMQLENFPVKLGELKDFIDGHEVIVIALAVHNSSVTAFFKNALDWLSRAGKDYRVFQNKQIILLSASPGIGSMNAIEHAATILNTLGGAVATKIPITGYHKRLLVKEGKLTIIDESLLTEITTAIKTIKNK